MIPYVIQTPLVSLMGTLVHTYCLLKPLLHKESLNGLGQFIYHSTAHAYCPGCRTDVISPDLQYMPYCPRAQHNFPLWTHKKTQLGPKMCVTDKTLYKSETILKKRNADKEEQGVP